MGQVGERARLRPGLGDARASELDLEDAIRAVRRDHDDHVERFACTGPQRLERIHAAAVGLERDHLAVGTRERGADRGGQPLADRAAGERETVVRRGAGREREVGQAARRALVDDDRVLGLERRERLAERPRGQRATRRRDALDGRRGDPRWRLEAQRERFERAGDVLSDLGEQ
jgi:hypothetical protein